MQFLEKWVPFWNNKKESHYSTLFLRPRVFVLQFNTMICSKSLPVS